MKELELLERKDLRDVNVSRIEVLDRVGGLLLLANTELATTEQVAKFYGVDNELAQKVYQRNKDEFDADGLKSYSKSDLLEVLNGQDVQLKNMQGKSIITINNEEIIVPNRGMKLFTRRAILRMGMLLRDSEVAKEVRTRLLDIVQDTSIDNPTTILNVINEISEEKQIMLEIVEAQCNGDLLAVDLAHTKLHALKNRRIAELENQNKLITTNALTIIESRDIINRIVRTIAQKEYSCAFGKAYNELYSKVNYKLGINIRARIKQKGQTSLLDTLTDEETYEVEKICRNWAVDNGLDLESLLKI